MPFKEAVMTVEPGANALASPDAFTVATAGVALVQVTVLVTTACVLSL
jgi:hypothetical protein